MATRCSLSTTRFESAILGYVVQGLHCTGFAKLAAIFVARCRGVPYHRFYSRLSSPDGPPSFRAAIDHVRSTLRGWLNGGKLCQMIPQYGAMQWLPEDALFLHMIDQKKAALSELRAWLEWHFALPHELAADLIAFTEAQVVAPTDSAALTVNTKCDWWSFLQQTSGAPPSGDVRTTFATRPWQSHEEYALEILRYGRKAGLLQRRVRRVERGKEG